MSVRFTVPPAGWGWADTVSEGSVHALDGDSTAGPVTPSGRPTGIRAAGPEVMHLGQSFAPGLPGGIWKPGRLRHCPKFTDSTHRPGLSHEEFDVGAILPRLTDAKSLVRQTIDSYRT